MRGVLILLGIIFFSAIFCGVIPFVVMPNAGIAVALPVIMVPGETLWEDFLGIHGLTVTNTIVGTLVADVLVLLFAFGAVRSLKTVPGRLQGMFEVLTEALYGLAKQSAGKNARTIFPLMATIFLFLLVANWVKLVPGAESVGLMHCADEGINGYEKDGIRLDVTAPMDTGVRATQENYDLCHHKEKYGEVHDPAADAVTHSLEAAVAQSLGKESFTIRDEVENEQSLAEYLAGQQVDGEPVDVDAIMTEATALLAAELEGIEEGAEAEAEGDADAGHEEEAAAEDADAEADAEHGEAGMSLAQMREHPDEAIAAAMAAPFYRDDIYAVTPFVRGASTDLNLTLALGLLAFVAIQYFGVRAQGIGYFAKFVNTPALENMGKNPMGIMDFVVGLLEIVLELAKILSFGFRLFGNLFAGGVLLFVMSFLVAMMVPAGVYVLELFVGLIQAFVFAMLLLVFSAMAMEGHGHEEGH